MLILGIDPGSRFCGYGLIQTEKNKIVAAGCDVMVLKQTLPLSERLLSLKQQLDEIIGKYQPDIAAVETIFYGKNIQSAFTLGHARGVILLVLAEKQIPFFEYSPREIKLSIVGNGNASKKQVRYMVQQGLKLKHAPTSEDAADALAIAMTHFNKKRFG